MAIARPQLEAIVDALTVVLPAREPADAQLRRFFREHKNLGQRDRGIVADTVYAALRRRRLLESITPHATPREIALATLVKLQGVGLSATQALGAVTNQVTNQAFLLATDDIFRVAAGLMVILIPCVWLTKRARGAGAANAAAD